MQTSKPVIDFAAARKAIQKMNEELAKFDRYSELRKEFSFKKAA